MEKIKKIFNQLNTKKTYLLLFGVNLLFLFIAGLDSFSGLLKAWEQDEYSHGYLIPLLAILIGWHRLTDTKPEAKTNGWGVWIIFSGGLLMSIGQLAAFETPIHYGFILCLTGLILSYWGMRVTLTLAPALLYLLFAVPLPRLIYVNLSQDLQLISSTLGVIPLKLLNLSVFQDGNIIDLGTIKLQVVEACNGLRYLFPLMSFGFLVALLLEDRFWKRAFIFLSTIPITVAMNAFRISLIGITVNYWGQEMAEGLIHDLEGFTIFSLCLLLLFAEVWLLMKIGKTGTLRHDYAGLPSGKLFSTFSPNISKVIMPLILSGIFTLIISTNAINQRVEIIPQHKPFALFPLTLQDWKGKYNSVDAQTLKALDLSDYWIADYTQKESNTPINLYIAYYESQRVGSSVHSPANCLPGSGWVIESSTIHSIPVGERNQNYKRVLIRKGENRTLVYYWFDMRGRTLSSQYGVKWYLFWDSITKNRTDGALVRLTTPLLKHENEKEGDKRLTDFLSKVQPNIKKFIPQNE